MGLLTGGAASELIQEVEDDMLFGPSLPLAYHGAERRVRLRCGQLLRLWPEMDPNEVLATATIEEGAGNVGGDARGGSSERLSRSPGRNMKQNRGDAKSSSSGGDSASGGGPLSWLWSLTSSSSGPLCL